MRCDRCKEEIDTTFDGDDTPIFKVAAVGYTIGEQSVGECLNEWTFCQGCWFDVDNELES